MDRELIKEVIKDMLKTGEIKLYIATEVDSFEVTTEIQVSVDGEEVQSHKDSVFLRGE